MTRPLILIALCLAISSLAHSQPQTKPKTPTQFRALIVSGGPSFDYNQYAIESNARYIEKLTANADWQRVLFADGKKTSRTISTIETAPDAREQLVFAWLFDTDNEVQRTVYRAPTLQRLDGASTRTNILKTTSALAHQVKNGDHALLYFTGHGGTGQKRRLSLTGLHWEEDYDNTNYATWGDGEIEVKELAKSLESWPQTAPLVLVMVQCHAGGFANLLFQDGDPRKPLLNRDFCGFFAATGERESSGCTSEVNERDYQDFTTHFFAALSGRSRDGRVVAGADYDHNGAVSLLEAYAWTNLQDGSVDVPVCTSDMYLRALFPAERDTKWIKTPYSQLVEGTTPWQKVLLDGLSKSLRLTGENRLSQAVSAHTAVQNRIESGESSLPASLDTDALRQQMGSLRTTLLARFKGLRAPHRSAAFARAKKQAIRWLRTRPAEVKALDTTANLWSKGNETDAAREAMLWRFVRACRTRFLENLLWQKGTAEQKAAFANIRLREGRNPLVLGKPQ